MVLGPSFDEHPIVDDESPHSSSDSHSQADGEMVALREEVVALRATLDQMNDNTSHLNSEYTRRKMEIAEVFFWIGGI